MIRISYWVFPILSGTIWLATLLGLLLYWIIDENRAHYPSMNENQHIAYISDVGASALKPLFVTGCVLTTIFLDLSFAVDRWLRHLGRLAPNTTRGEKVLSALTIFFAVIGTVGLIGLSAADTARYPRLHNIFLLFFIGGYILSAIFICWEYQKLGMRYREHGILLTSFWIKLIFVIVEIILAIGFVSCTGTRRYNEGAILEWIIAFIFSAYVFSFYVDLYPAVRTKEVPRGEAWRASPSSSPPAKRDGSRQRYDSGREMEEGRRGGASMSVSEMGLMVGGGGAAGNGGGVSGESGNVSGELVPPAAVRGAAPARNF